MSSNRMRVLLVSMLAVFAVSAVASSSASAACYKVAVAGTGKFEKSTCAGAEGTKEYIKISKLETELKSGEWCAKVEEKETGTFEDAACTKGKAKGEYIKVLKHFYQPGFWLCHKVKNFEGVYKDKHCRIVGGNENWTWAYVTNNNVIHACVRKVPGQYNDGYCQELGGVERWAWVKWGVVHKFPGTIGVSKLKGTVAGVKITIECSGGTTATGKLEENGVTKENALTYTGCKIVGELGETCAVKATLETKKLAGTQTPTGEAEGRIEDTFAPEEASFIEIAVENNGSKTCTPKGTYKVLGSQGCEVDKSNAEAKESKEEHELICKPSLAGSKLELGGNKAEYEGTVKNKLEIENEEKVVETDDYFVEE